MPFDGLGFLPTQPKTSLWDRLVLFMRGAGTAEDRVPPGAFQPLPPDQAGNTTLQVLLVGRALIEDRKNWVQRRYETRDGRRCAVGALRRAARILNVQAPQTGANALLLTVAMSRGFNDIESMNDNSGHKHVLAAFDEAIARARR